MSEPRGPCHSRREDVQYEHRTGAELWVVPGIQDQGKIIRSQSAMTLNSHCYLYTH